MIFPKSDYRFIFFFLDIFVSSLSDEIFFTVVFQ